MIKRIKEICDYVSRGTTPDYTDEGENKVMNQATFSKGWHAISEQAFQIGSSEALERWMEVPFSEDKGKEQNQHLHDIPDGSGGAHAEGASMEDKDIEQIANDIGDAENDGRDYEDPLAAIHYQNRADDLNQQQGYDSDEIPMQVFIHIRNQIGRSGQRNTAKPQRCGGKKETEQNQSSGSDKGQKNCEIERCIGFFPFTLGHQSGADSGASVGEKSRQNQQYASKGPQQRYSRIEFHAQELTGNDTIGEDSDHSCDFSKNHGQGCGQKDGGNVILLKVNPVF